MRLEVGKLGEWDQFQRNLISSQAIEFCSDGCRICELRNWKGLEVLIELWHVVIIRQRKKQVLLSKILGQRLNYCRALPSFYFWTSNPLSHEKELCFILGTISHGGYAFPGVGWRSVDECFWLKWLKKLQINKRKPIKVGFVDPTNKLSTHFWANRQIFVPRHCNFFIKITFKQHTTLDAREPEFIDFPILKAVWFVWNFF